MDVHAAHSRCFQDRLGQDQPISGDDGQIRLQSREIRLLLCVAKRLRRSNLQPELLRALVDGGLPVRLAAPGGPGRLAIDRNDLVTRLDQRIQRRNGEVRATP